MPAAPAATASELSRYQYVQLHMGVQVRMLLYAQDEATAERAAQAAFARVAALNKAASDYQPDSELNRLCAAAGGPPVQVSEDLFVMLQRAQHLSQLSDGAFDITVKPLVALWREARRTGKLPSSEEIDTARRLVGWRKVKLDPEQRTVQLETPGMKLDLGGIAKGYACDLAIAQLKAHGIDSALVEAGGDIVVSDAAPGREGWRVEIVSEDPQQDGQIVTLTNRAISTSGDLEQFVVIDGKRYSHVVDPRTGIGTTDRALVTVIAPDGLTSDGLATTGCVMGPAVRKVVAAFKDTTVAVRTAHD